MRTLFLLSLLILGGHSLTAQSLFAGAGATPDGWMMWARGGGGIGIEAARTKGDRALEIVPDGYVRRASTSIDEIGLSTQWRRNRLVLQAAAGGSVERTEYSFQFLYPTMSGEFVAQKWRAAPYASATASYRIVGHCFAFGRFTQRMNAAFVEPRTFTAGLVLEF